MLTKEQFYVRMPGRDSELLRAFLPTLVGFDVCGRQRTGTTRQSMGDRSIDLLVRGQTRLDFIRAMNRHYHDDQVENLGSFIDIDRLFGAYKDVRIQALFDVKYHGLPIRAGFSQGSVVHDEHPLHADLIIVPEIREEYERFAGNRGVGHYSKPLCQSRVSKVFITDLPPEELAEITKRKK